MKWTRTPDGQYVFDGADVVGADPSNPGALILRSRKTGATKSWVPPGGSELHPSMPPVSRRPSILEPPPAKGEFSREHPWRQDIGTVAKWAPPIATSFAQPEVGIPWMMALTGLAGTGGALAEQAINKQPLDVGKAAKFGAGQGALEGAGRAVSPAFEWLSRVPGRAFRGAMGLATNPFGAMTEEQIANREFWDWAKQNGIDVPPDVLVGATRSFGGAARYYADESLLSRSIGKRFLQKQREQVDKAWEEGLAGLQAKGGARTLGLKAKSDFVQGLKNLKDRISQVYDQATEMSPEAKVNLSEPLADIVREMRETLQESRENPGLVPYNQKKLDVLRLAFPKASRKTLMSALADKNMSNESVAKLNGNLPIRTARRLITILNRSGERASDPDVASESKLLSKRLWNAIYGDDAKLVDADPRAISLYRRGNRMYRQLKSVYEESPSFKSMKEMTNPELLSRTIKPQHVTDMNILRRVIDKYGRGAGKYGMTPSEGMDAIRLSVLREALKDPEGFGNVVFSGLRGKAERKYGQSVIYDLFSRDAAGKRILKNIDMITTLYQREPRFNPSGTGGALMTARGFREIEGVVRGAVRAVLRRGTVAGSGGLAGGAVGMAVGGPAGAAVGTAVADLAVPYALAKIIYSPRATQILVHGLKTYGTLGPRILPEVLRAIQFADEDFGKMVEHAASGHADVGGARYTNAVNP